MPCISASSCELHVLIERACCGTGGGYSSGIVEGRIDLVKSLCADPDSSYIVQVSGDSMLHAGIADGEYVVVDPGMEVESGDIVLVSLNGCMICKRFHRDGEHVFLRSDNPAYETIVINEHSNLVIIGCVVSGFSLYKRRIVAA